MVMVMVVVMMVCSNVSYEDAIKDVETFEQLLKVFNLSQADFDVCLLPTCLPTYLPTCHLCQQHLIAYWCACL
jgi:hypothetical protein